MNGVHKIYKNTAITNNERYKKLHEFKIMWIRMWYDKNYRHHVAIIEIRIYK